MSRDSVLCVAVYVPFLHLGSLRGFLTFSFSNADYWHLRGIHTRDAYGGQFCTICEDGHAVLMGQLYASQWL